jgi:hypothetical protein
MIDSANAWWLAFDNLSRVTTRFSDSLMPIVHRRGFATVSVPNDGEKIFNCARPILFNGIDELADPPGPARSRNR